MWSFRQSYHRLPSQHICNVVFFHSSLSIVRYTFSLCVCLFIWSSFFLNTYSKLVFYSFLRIYLYAFLSTAFRLYAVWFHSNDQICNLLMSLLCCTNRSANFYDRFMACERFLSNGIDEVHVYSRIISYHYDVDWHPWFSIHYYL